MPHSWLSLLNFDILRWQLYRNGEAGEQGLSEHDFHCESVDFFSKKHNSNNDDLPLNEFEGAPEEYAGKSSFGLCKLFWNCATVVLLLIALGFAMSLLLDETTVLSSTEGFTDDEHRLPQLAVQVGKEYRAGFTVENRSTTSTLPYHYTIEVTHAVIPRADSSGKRYYKTYGSPGAQASPAYPDSPVHDLELCNSTKNVDGTLGWEDDYLATQIHTYYCLPPELLVQGTYGSNRYQYVAVDILALSELSPETGVSLAMRSPLPGSSKKFTRWESY